MSEKELLFEIKPKYSIGYTILNHFWDIVVFICIMIVIRTTATVISKCNCSIFYISNMFNNWIIYKEKN